MSSESFQSKYSEEERKAESTRILARYASKVPVIVERARGSSLEELSKKKYLVPRDMIQGELQYVIRKRLSLSSSEGLYMYVDGVLLQSGALLRGYASPDGFIYVEYATEATFGA